MPHGERREKAVPAGLILLFIGLAVLIAIGGALVYQSQEELIRGQVTGDLTSNAHLKADQIAEWRGERLGDVAVLSRDMILIAGVKELLTSPAPAERERLIALFEEISTSYHYRNVQLVDPAGQVVLSLDPRESALGPALADQVATVLATGKPVLTDLMPGNDNVTPRMYAIAPLVDTSGAGPVPIGSIILTIDPGTDLYPLVQTWPVPSSTAETLLVERQGDHVLYLNTLRYRNNTALNLTIPLTRTDVPSVQAVQGRTGPFTGTDYRDVEVLSVLEPIAGSPWFIVAKMDTTEAFASWRSTATLIFILTAGMLAAAGIITALLWQRRQKYYYRSLYAAESALRDEEAKIQRVLQESEARLRKFYDSGLFGVIFWNMDGKITDANDTFLSMTGYSRHDLEAGRIDWGAMTPPEYRERDGESVKELMATGRNAMPFKKEYFRKDGTRLPILVAGAMLDERMFDGVAFVLDISALTRAEDDLRRSEVQYREVIENMQDAYFRADARGILTAANPAAARMYGYASVDGMIGTPVASLYRSAEERTEILRHIDAEGKVSDYEGVGRRKDGSLFWVSLNVRVERDAMGKVLASEGFVRDTSVRRKADEERKEFSRQRQLALDAARLGWWHYDPVTRISTYDERYREIFGVSGHERPNEEILTLLHPDDLPRVWAAVDAALDPADPQPYEIEYRVNRTDGVTRWVRAHGVPSFEGSGPERHAVSFVGTVEDITERKKAEDALRETSEYLQNLITYANAPIIVWDPQFRITRFNHAFEQLTGRTEREVTGQHLEILFPETSRESSLDLIRKTLAGERWEIVEIPILHSSGRVSTVLWNSANITSPDGTIISTIAQGTDITERKEAEQALRENERKFRVLFTSMAEGSALHEILYDPAGTPVDYRILDVNPAFERIVGVSHSDAVGRTSREVYRVGTPPFLETYARVAATGRAEIFEVYFPPMEKHFSISAFSPETGQFATIFEDITGRKQAEAQREVLIRELEQKNTELERFTYTVSHDLKSPLITIKGFAGLLEIDQENGDPGQLKKDVQRITQAADTMQQLLSDVLELSRIGRVIAPPQATPFGDIAREAAELLAGPLAGRGVAVEIAPGLPEVNVDRTRIREVLVNLIENAAKFMGDQKQPVVRIGVITGSEGPVFFVQDNGIGIEPRYIQRIFNLFEKLNPSVPGTGVGLTIVKRIIEVHGGKIWVESAGPGKGTTFFFTLPAAERSAP